MATPSFATVAIRSCRYFSRAHASVALGVAAATAVIVGALIVGDSVRSSLRTLVVERLSNIHCLLQARVFFDPQTAYAAAGESNVKTGILFSSNTVESRGDVGLLRASQVQLLAFEASFWEDIDLPQPPTIGLDEVALNQALATELGVVAGDEITLIMNDPSGAPSDNPLGKREGRVLRLPRQQVVAILPDRSVGGISLVSGQQAAKNVFANLETIQDLLECGEQTNAACVLSLGPEPDGTLATQDVCDKLNLSLRPTLEDYDLQLDHYRRVFPDSKLDSSDAPEVPPEVVYDYYQVSSKALIMDMATSGSLSRQLGRRGDPTLAYVANGICKIAPVDADLQRIQRMTAPRDRRSTNGPSVTSIPRNSRDSIFDMLVQAPADTEPLSRVVPYSIAVGVDPRSSEWQLSKYTEIDGERMMAPHCWINSWLAEQLEAQPGDWIRLDYFEPETVDGNAVEVSKRFLVVGIVPLTEPTRGYGRGDRVAQFATAPTAFNDPHLTPTVPGITDQESISNWDVPFELENKIEAIDDTYWKNHRLTPKVFIPFQFAAHPLLFGSRFGNTTAIRIPATEIASTADLRSSLAEALLETRGEKGLVFEPIRLRQLAAASGTTPFDMLFLSLSFFVIVAALLLVYLLFKLGLQQRTSELGVLQTQGFTAARIRRLLLTELSLVAALGSIVGIGLGILYARGIIAGLESWWLGAIATRFLRFHATPLSLVWGALAGFSTSLVAILIGLRAAIRRPPLDNLRGRSLEGQNSGRPRRMVYAGLAFVMLLGAGGMMIAAFGQSGMARAGTFFGSGMLLLAATLSGTRQLMDLGRAGRDDSGGSLTGLAWRTIGRNPGRSLLSLSLLSVAAFLIASMGVFQISPSVKGYGGFDLMAESSQPIYRNIGSGRVREEMLGSQAADKLSGTTIVSARTLPGEDASCNNLFQVARPTVLGLSARLRELHDITPDSVAFEWAQTSTPNNPWNALTERATGTATNPIPVILDQNTAMWSLKQGAALGAPIQIPFDNQLLHFKTVGLLSNSVLQGKLIISEENFQRCFPEISGYSFFLVRSSAQQDPQVIAETLEEGWSDAGLDVRSSRDILAAFLGVQNTYISAFQSLGALGLLLGTFGLIAVQVRSVLERQREFAVMRAVGFAPSRLAKILSMETTLLLGGGVIIGVACAAVALIPYVVEVGPSLSFFNPLLMLGAVVAIGFAAAAIAIRVSNRRSVLEGLRSE